MAYQTLGDLLNADAMQQAQLGAMGQESQLRNLQVQGAQQDMAHKSRLRDLFQQLPEGADPATIIPHLIRAGDMQSAKQLYDLTQKQNDAYTLGEGQQRFEGGRLVASVPRAPKEFQPSDLARLTSEMNALPQGDPRRGLYSKAITKMTTREQAGGGTPYFTPVQTAGGVMSFNARTGRMEPIQVGGAAVLGAQADPSLQGRIAGAREAGKSGVEMQTEAKKAIKKSDQLLGIAQQAKELLNKGPTGSGIGAAVDVAGRMIGQTSESSKTAADLETLSGWMVANVPRMEGPQSNFDVQNYQTMAAKVGDRTVPVSERKSALNTLITLQNKYKRLNQDTVNPPGQPAAPPVNTLPTGWSVQVNP